MDKTIAQKFKLGIFVIAGIFLLLLGTYLIGNKDNLFGRSFTVYADFNNIMGLEEGGNVRYSGLNIGTVKEIEMINDSIIRVEMSIKNKMKDHLLSNAVASVGSDGIVGNIIVNINPGKGSAPSLRSGDQIPTDNKDTTLEMLSTLSTTNDNVAKLSENLVKITGSLNNGNGTLGALLKDSIMAIDLKQTFTNLNDLSNKADNTIKTVNNLVGRMNVRNSVAGVVFNDSIYGKKVKNLVSNLEVSSEKIEDITTNLNTITLKLNGKNNIVHYLATDTTIVAQTKDIMKNADQAVKRLNDNMEALEHNFLFRGYFRKQNKKREKEARKEKRSH